MGTRSTIGMVNSNGGVVGIYCHWDGYPEHNGRILIEHYRTPDRIRSLLKLGDLSSLGPKIGRKHKFDQYIEGVCTAYGRDRGEKNTEATLFVDEAEFLKDDRGQDFTYLFKEGKWYCWDAYTNKQIDLYALPVDERA